MCAIPTNESKIFMVTQLASYVFYSALHRVLAENRDAPCAVI